MVDDCEEIRFRVVGDSGKRKKTVAAGQHWRVVAGYEDRGGCRRRRWPWFGDEVAAVGTRVKIENEYGFFLLVTVRGHVQA